MAQQEKKEKKKKPLLKIQIPVTVPSEYPSSSSSLPVDPRQALEGVGTSEILQETVAGSDIPQQAVPSSEIPQGALSGSVDVKEETAFMETKMAAGSTKLQTFDITEIQQSASTSDTQGAGVTEIQGGGGVSAKAVEFLRPEAPKVAETSEIRVVEEKRPKRLRNRRGSNAGLTINVTYDPNAQLFMTSPTMEETSEDSLLMASHLIARAELRDVLNNIQGLHAEFWQIPTNHPEKPGISGCGTKNRYETVLPNEKTRVKLTGSEEPESYINANYIRGYKKEERVFIATQGPLGHTIKDLYKMIWNENCPIIVMVTKFFEKKEKCECYFPQETNKPEVYGDYKVTVLSVEEREGYSLREFLLQFEEKEKRIWHYWCDSWADHQTPDDPKPIISMVQDVRQCRDSYGTFIGDVKVGPIVVHCSAGIGRTGCFIAIYLAIAQLLDEGKVDILGIVSQLRCDRGGMVQTAEQYVFVHEAVAEFASTLPEPSRSFIF